MVSCTTSTKKILNGLYFNKGELETAKDRIRKLSEIVDTTKQPGFDQDDCQPSSFKADIIRQKVGHLWVITTKPLEGRLAVA